MDLRYKIDWHINHVKINLKTYIYGVKMKSPPLIVDAFDTKEAGLLTQGLYGNNRALAFEA